MFSLHDGGFECEQLFTALTLKTVDVFSKRFYHIWIATANIITFMFISVIAVSTTNPGKYPDCNVN